ncbi:hypothetical protein Csa_006402 [Cucumis sativus]|nr:hypothetical protein Csa_006402 [Cucumis sativus]
MEEDGFGLLIGKGSNLSLTPLINTYLQSLALISIFTIFKCLTRRLIKISTTSTEGRRWSPSTIFDLEGGGHWSGIEIH